MTGGGAGVDVAHLFHADDDHDVAPSGLDSCDGGECCDGTGCTGRFVARAGLACERRVDRRDQSSELSLAEEEFAHEVAHFERVDLGRVDPGVGQGAEHGFGETVERGAFEGRPVLGEVGLVSAEDVNAARHGRRASSWSWFTQQAWNPCGTR